MMLMSFLTTTRCVVEWFEIQASIYPASAIMFMPEQTQKSKLAIYRLMLVSICTDSKRVHAYLVLMLLQAYRDVMRHNWLSLGHRSKLHPNNLSRADSEKVLSLSCANSRLL